MRARREPVPAETCYAVEHREVRRAEAAWRAREAVRDVTGWAAAWSGRALASGGLAGLVRRRSVPAARAGVPRPALVSVSRPAAGGPDRTEQVA